MKSRLSTIALSALVAIASLMQAHAQTLNDDSRVSVPFGFNRGTDHFAAKERDLKVEFVRIPEAKQFRESQAMRLKALQQNEVPKPKTEEFPEQLFATVEDD